MGAEQNFHDGNRGERRDFVGRWLVGENATAPCHRWPRLETPPTSHSPPSKIWLIQWWLFPGPVETWHIRFHILNRRRNWKIPLIWVFCRLVPIHFYSESVVCWRLGSLALIRYNFSQMNHIILVWLVVLGDNRLDLFSQFKQNYSQL